MASWSVFNRIGRKCVESSIHREHVMAAVMITTMDVCIAVNAPAMVMQVLVIVTVFGREILSVAFDETAGINPQNQALTQTSTERERNPENGN